MELDVLVCVDGRDKGCCVVFMVIIMWHWNGKIITY